jgi:hypothetical protein
MKKTVVAMLVALSMALAVPAQAAIYAYCGMMEACFDDFSGTYDCPGNDKIFIRVYGYDFGPWDSTGRVRFTIHSGGSYIHTTPTREWDGGAHTWGTGKGYMTLVKTQGLEMSSLGDQEQTVWCQ